MKMAEKINPEKLKQMTTDEREALVKKLDDDLDEYLNKLESSATSKYKVGKVKSSACNKSNR